MVAESLPSPPSTPSPPKKRAKPLPIPFGIRLKARNLYLSQSLPYKEIAHRTGLSAKQVENMVSREKLASIRKNREQGILKATDSRAQAVLAQFNETLAEEAEEISLGAIARARQEVEEYGKDSARNFQSLTGGIANLVKASRMVRGLDAKGAASAVAGDTVIFVKLERVGVASGETNAIKNAQLPAIDISASTIPALPSSQ